MIAKSGLRTPRSPFSPGHYFRTIPLQYRNPLAWHLNLWVWVRVLPAPGRLSVTAMYVILEYVVCIVLALLLGALGFGVSLVALLGQEGGKLLVASSRALGQHATRLIQESRSETQMLAEETHPPGQ